MISKEGAEKKDEQEGEFEEEEVTSSHYEEREDSEKHTRDREEKRNNSGNNKREHKRRKKTVIPFQTRSRGTKPESRVAKARQCQGIVPSATPHVYIADIAKTFPISSKTNKYVMSASKSSFTSLFLSLSLL